MEMLFSQEEVWELDRQEIARTSKEDSLLSSIKNLTETLNLSVEQAMAALRIADIEQPKYLERLKES